MLLKMIRVTLGHSLAIAYMLNTHFTTTCVLQMCFMPLNQTLTNGDKYAYFYHKNKFKNMFKELVQECSQQHYSQ